MPPPKRRKLNSSRNKKPKRSSQQSPNEDNEIEWAAREILAESSAEYLIDWEPNSDTGEKYSPTWEPKRNASKTLIKSWKQDRVPRNSFTTEFPSVISLSNTTSRQSHISGENLYCSESSSHSTYKINRQKRQVRGHGPNLKTRKLSTQKRKRHICSSTEDSDSETAKAIDNFSTGIEVVDSTSYRSDSECVQGSALVDFGYTRIRPSAEIRVSERGLTGSYLHLSRREINLASQLRESNSTYFIENSASPSTELGNQDNRVTLLPDEQTHSRKSVTLAHQPNSVPSYILYDPIDEIPESWEDKDSRRLIAGSRTPEVCATTTSEEQAEVSSHNSVSDEENLSNRTLPSAYPGSGCEEGVSCGLNSCIVDHPIIASSLLSGSRISQPAQDFLSLQLLPTQPFDELDSSNISNTAAEKFVSSTTSDEGLKTLPFSLNEEVRSSISNNKYTVIATTLNPPRKNLTQDSSFQNDNTILPSERQNLSHQTQITSLYSQKESFESTFETLSALASSYVTPESGNQAFSSNSTCERLSSGSVAEVPQSHHTGFITTSFDYPSHQISSTFGNKSDVLVLSPILLSELQSSVRSSDSEDISTPFRTQISISEHSLHTTEPALADSKSNEKTKSWEQYILKKFDIRTSDRSSHYQDRVLNLLKVLNNPGGISYWKADAIILLFIAINPHIQKNCTRDITSLARELYKAVRSVNESIVSEGQEVVAEKPLLLKQDSYERLKQKYSAPLAIEGDNRITLDNPALRRPGQMMEKNTSPNIEMKDKGPLSTTRDRSMQSPANSVGDYEVADIVTDTSLTEPLLEEEEYILPLPMQGTTAQQYRDIIPYYNTNIKRFTSRKRQKAKLELKPVKRLLEHLSNITYHVDLENDRAFTQEYVSKSIQAKWDETCSSKFRVLGAIFDDLKDKNIHIAITLRSGKPVTILENWLKSKKILFLNTGQGGMTADVNKPVTERLFVSIITDEADSIGDNVSGINAIFSLDCSFAANTRRIKELQAKSNIPGRPAPIISFIIYASQEHILRCIPASLSEIERLQILASYVSSWRLNAGKLPSEAREIIDCTSLVSDWLLTITEQGRAQNPELDAIDWPLPLIDKTDIIVTAETLHSVSPPKDIHYSLKRSNQDQIDNVESSKRVRISSQSVSKCQNDVSITHVSETNLASSQHNQNVEHQASFGSIKSSQLNKTVDAKIRLLKEQLQLAQEKVKDLENASEDIQRRYDKQHSDMNKLHEENKQLRSTCEREKNHNVELAEAVDHAFAETQKIQEQERLGEAESTKPEPISFLDAELQLKESRQERDKLEKKVKKQDEELDFIRERYREASDAAIRSTQQAFENALRDAQRRASGEAARLRQMHYSNYTSRLEDENKSLKVLNENLADLLRRKDDELKTLRTRTMLSTRANSIPRSPRFGPGGSGSRAGSPPTPKSHHPLRTL